MSPAVGVSCPSFGVQLETWLTAIGPHDSVASDLPAAYPYGMTDKQAVVDALQRLPENAALEEITEELQIMAAVRRGRASAAAGRSKSHDEVKEIVKSWASEWASK
jgi:predicted transcriptional regulator